MPDSPMDTIRTSGWREGAKAATTLEVHPESISQMMAPDNVPPPHGPARLAAPPDENPEVLTIGKWAAVVLQSDEAAARAALAPLIDHRRDQGHLWQDGIIVVQPSLSGKVESWCRRLKHASQDGLPHYLLLVGGPDRFPFEMQYELDLRQATGRLDAGDTPGGSFSWEACRCYAEKVVAYERGQIDLDPKPLFYSLTSDTNTRISHEHLVLPLSNTIPGGVTPLYGAEATVSNLCHALTAKQSPKLVFTASHGVEFPVDQLLWGALTDANYSGDPGHTLVSARLAANAKTFGHGAIVFAFACFSAGLPDCSNFSFLAGESDKVTNIGARVSPLPRQLLGHPQGPVAFVGHVDRVTAVAFQNSFGMDGITPYRHFTSWLYTKDGTVGRALGTMREDARLVGAQIAGALAHATQNLGNLADIRAAGRKWIGFHDYRNFILLGDPAITPP